VEDDSTALVYLNERYYDASLMRFISVDPISRLGNPQTLNVYSYALNNPTSASDPLGLEAIWMDDASHPDGGYYQDSVSGAIWDSTLQAWTDPLTGAVWDPVTGLWTDPKNGAVFVEDVGWVDPATGAVYIEEGWYDPNTGCVWSGGSWACPTLPTEGAESSTAVYIPFAGGPSDLYVGPAPPGAGSGNEFDGDRFIEGLVNLLDDLSRLFTYTGGVAQLTGFATCASFVVQICAAGSAAGTTAGKLANATAGVASLASTSLKCGSAIGGGTYSYGECTEGIASTAIDLTYKNVVLEPTIAMSIQIVRDFGPDPSCPEFIC
jgi:RHS repeat-associated protein